MHSTTSRIAICTPNTFEAMGLRGIVERMMPGAEVCIFAEAEVMTKDEIPFFHYFIDSRTLLSNASFFIQHARQTIVLTHGQERLPIEGFHTLNIYQPEDRLVRSILTLAAHGHANRNIPIPESIFADEVPAVVLTPRETDVLRLLVRGCINKEIADRLGVALTTVITHRKNLTQKLGMRSVSALTIYAVTRGIVKMEEIGAGGK